MKRQTLFLIALFFSIFFAGCQNGGIETATITIISEPPTILAPQTEETITKQVPSTSTPEPRVTRSATETIFPTFTPTPHPLFAYTIPGLRQRDFPGGKIQIRSIMEQNTAFTRYYIDYPSDGLTITGMMYVPAGVEPFPVLILLHGYVDRELFFSSADTWQAAEYFARNGYLILSPDFRSWGESDTGLSLFHTGLVADVLNLINSVPSLPEADSSKVGLWGHSMGGGIATKVLTIDDQVRAAVLYAPNSADDADLIARWGPGCLAGQSEAAGDHCNPGEVIPSDTSADLMAAYLTGAADPDFLRKVAPYYFLDEVTAPLQIHIGTNDGEFLSETPVEWSVKLAEALRAVEKPVEFFEYVGEGHAFVGQNWTIMLERALALFDGELKISP